MAERLEGDVDLETGLVCSCCMEAGTCQDMNAAALTLNGPPNPVAGSVCDHVPRVMLCFPTMQVTFFGPKF